MKKLSYPVYDNLRYKNPHDLDKWINTLNTINYYKQSQHVDVTNKIIKDWDDNEKFDFVQWVKFYQEGVHLKYKTAQKKSYYANGDYFLPLADQIIEDKPKFYHPGKLIEDKSFAKDDLQEKEKKEVISKIRAKILARLKAAEKLLESEDSHLLLGSEYDSVIDSLYELKKTISKINKSANSGKIYTDLIIREGNKLSRDGLFKAAKCFYVIAQTASQEVGQVTNSIQPSIQGGAQPSLETPIEGAGSTNVADATTNDASLPAELPPESSKPEDDSVTRFLKNLNPSEKLESDDSFEVEDEEEQFDVYDGEFVVKAQLAPAQPETPEVAATPEVSQEPAIEVEDDKEKNHALNTLFDSKLDNILGEVKLSDIVSKLEQISNIFKNRELPRQLSLVDLMLNKLDLASYFPELAEATNKSLESNNYVSTRIDSMLARLYSQMNVGKIDLNGGEKVTSPEIDALKQNFDKKEEENILKHKLKEKKESDKLKQEVMPEAPAIEVDDIAPDATQAPAAPQKPAIEVNDQNAPRV